MTTKKLDIQCRPWIIQKRIWAWVILIGSFHVNYSAKRYATYNMSMTCKILLHLAALTVIHAARFPSIFHHMAKSASSVLDANAIKIGLLAAFVCEMHCLLNFARNGQLISIPAHYSSPHSHVTCVSATAACSPILHIWPNEMTKQGYLDLHMYRVVYWIRLCC